MLRSWILLLALLSTTACNSSPQMPGTPIDAETEAALTVAAIEAACPLCGDHPHLYVRDQRFGASTLVGDETGMPDAVRSEVLSAYPHATFVSRDEADALFVDGLVAGSGLNISFDQPEELDDGVVGIAVMTTTARDGAFGQTIQFQWDGTEWWQATEAETGVTVTTAVS